MSPDPPRFRSRAGRGRQNATVPFPAASLVLSRRAFDEARRYGTENVARADRADVIATTQSPVPVQLPDHPVNDEPAAGVATSVTVAPFGSSSTQVPPLEAQRAVVAPFTTAAASPAPVPTKVRVSA